MDFKPKVFGLLSVISRSMSIVTETDAIAELALSLFCFGKESSHSHFSVLVSYLKVEA